ncbi:MAG: hypothetical protein RLZZ479_466 [Bacteroidota bacterium]|jgi:hypothetical protein
MALIPDTLNLALKNAFEQAMLEFANTIASSPQGTDVSFEARLAAAETFAAIAAPAIDSYIRSQTIIIPPGQSVTTAGSAVAQTGATVAPSPAAIIS